MVLKGPFTEAAKNQASKEFWGEPQIPLIVVGYHKSKKGKSNRHLTAKWSVRN